MDKYWLLRKILGETYFNKLKQKRVSLFLDTGKKQIKIKPKLRTPIALIDVLDDALDYRALEAQITIFNSEFSRHNKNKGQ